MGTNNSISKAQRNKAQQFFQPVKAQRNFRYELLDSAQLRNGILDQVKTQPTVTSAFESSHSMQIPHFFFNFRQKKEQMTCSRKPTIINHYDRNGTNLRMYRIALLTETKN